MSATFIHRRFIFCTLLLCFGLGAAGCGQEDNAGTGETLAVTLQLPEGEHPSLFWYGVERRILTARRDGSLLKEWDWAGGKQVDIELDSDDGLEFRGFDRHGRLLVEGSAAVGKEKKISIPLRRVL